jgi:hypothetical protein
MMAMNLVLYWSINDSPSRILWVSPVYSQTDKVQKELMQAIGGTGIVETCNYSTNEIKLKEWIYNSYLDQLNDMTTYVV